MAALLMRKLIVPKIYFEPKALASFKKPTTYEHLFLPPDSYRAPNVLAIDRAGSGDVHAVHLFPGQINGLKNLKNLAEFIQLFLTAFPAHFKYVAVGTQTTDFVSKQQLFADDGIGRVGIIEIVENPSAPPEARIVVRPERFRVEHDWIEKFDNFQKKTHADMEIRD
ncbi:MAG TPA: hypothetical protein VFN62_04515 [Acidobacteriaceae bacterium]|nr:hypothetical protein [Acidobacteriaceae bacterium]